MREPAFLSLRRPPLMTSRSGRTTRGAVRPGRLRGTPARTTSDRPADPCPSCRRRSPWPCPWPDRPSRGCPVRTAWPCQPRH
ncbi:hypothetical protein ACFFX0_10015 [Citricoccus parietis]|uniref:Uncharacterized protein n=1 Tax=Citricoccus parietis TaxID=592307 RepID=A0ABV5FXW3_9MICC